MTQAPSLRLGAPRRVPTKAKGRGLRDSATTAGTVAVRKRQVTPTIASGALHHVGDTDVEQHLVDDPNHRDEKHGHSIRGSGSVHLRF